MASTSAAAAAGRSQNGDKSPELPAPPRLGLDFDQSLKRSRRSSSSNNESNNDEPQQPSNKRRKSRKEQMYEGWPEDLKNAHRWIFRVIRWVDGRRQPQDPQVEAAPNQMVLDYCRQYPMLASEKFPCDAERAELTPLKFLIFNLASEDVIAGFCQSFPQAVQHFDRKNDFFNLDGYPLHLACTRRQDDGDIIAVLAKAFPEAASTPNEQGFLPLHLLLEYRGFPPAVKAIQTLMDIYPQAALQKPPHPSDLPPPIYSILSSGQLALEHMECIYSRLPRTVTELNFPQYNCFRENIFNLDHAKTIARVLPQINDLNLQPTEWTPDAWLCFVQSCQKHASNLRRLALKPIAPQQGMPPTIRTTLFQFLYGCAGLQMLDLQGSPPTNNRAGTIGIDITAPIAHIVTNGRLVSLRVLGFQLTARPILEALRNNTQLRHLILHGLVTPTNPNEVVHLSTILEQHNVTLHNAQTVYTPYQLLPLELAKIQHYTRLNRLGRAAARHTTAEGMVQMLMAARGDPELQRAHPREGVGILYGLLRESPGVWSGGKTGR